MVKYAFVFPGQGSQTVGMLMELAQNYPTVKQTFEEASDILGYDLWQLCQEGPEESLNQTDKTQPALLAAGVAIWRVWQEQRGKVPVVMAGHSFGEYSALVCAQALFFTDAIMLAEKRGHFMQTAVPMGEGAMAAILGLSEQQITEICQTIAQQEIVEPVNLNAPGQIVIAGHTAAVKRAIAQAKQQGAKKAVLLPVSVPAHSCLMQPAAEKMAELISNITIATPRIPVIHNVDLSTKMEAAAIRSALVAQLYHPVRWVETIEKIVADGVTFIIESGPGKVLTSLNKRIARSIKTLSIVDSHTLHQALEAVETPV
jgi:[acyl-carrier-protein] S-malonyltransferase